jgi:hypothetical protein
MQGGVGAWLQGIDPRQQSRPVRDSRLSPIYGAPGHSLEQALAGGVSGRCVQHSTLDAAVLLI